MRPKPVWMKVLVFGVALCATISCSRPTRAAAELPKPNLDLPAEKAGKPATAVLAGGCFWCTEAVFEQLAGVSEVVAGYAGGTKETADYQHYHESNHAEVIRITYDPAKITYGELLRVLFTVIDPTTKDGQHPDYGHQYRSAVFYANDDQKRVAEAYIQQLNEAKSFNKPIATTVEPLNAFYPAEDYHQHYVTKNPDDPYVLSWSKPKVQKTREHFKGELKDAPTTQATQTTTQPAK